MANDIKNLPERPIDELRRHDTAIGLLEGQADDQIEHNERVNQRLNKLEEEQRELRYEIVHAKRVGMLLWNIARYAWKGALYFGIAAAGWGWNHSDKLQAFWDDVWKSDKAR